MLIYSKERLVPTDVNMMVIKDKSNEGYFYIHRALYDQAVIINDIYSDDFSMLIESLTNSKESRSDVDFFLENAPVPINALAPFLLLIKEELTEFVDMIGALHVMSGPLHFRNMLKIPFAMRNSMPSFSLSIREEYQLAWDRFMQNTMRYSDNMFHMPVNTPMNGVQTTTVVETEPEEQELTGYEDYGIDADTMAFLMRDDDPFAELDEEDEDSSSEETFVEPEPVYEPEPIKEPEPEPEPEPVKLSGIDALLGLS